MFFLFLQLQKKKSWTQATKMNKRNNIKLKNLCTAKETINNMKRQIIEWEKIFANHVSDGLVSKIYKKLLQLKEKRNLIKKWPEDLNRPFFKDIRLGNRYMKRCSASLIIREMQIKTTVRDYLTPVRMAIVKKQKITSVVENVEKREPLVHCWWEGKLMQLLWEAVWKFLNKLKIELPCDPAIPVLGIYLAKILTQKDTCTPMFIVALFTITKTWK